MTDNNNEQPESSNIFSRIIQAQFGTRQQIDMITEHMEDLFERWPSYKDRLTYLEWYHLFLDFVDKMEAAKEEHTPEQPDHSGKVTEKVLTDKNTAEQPVGEIPEEIMTWINKTAGMKDEYDNAVDVATELMIATYRKLQPEIEVLKDLVAGYEDWAKDVRLLTKEIDVILCGKNAAEQASLCDLIGPIAALTAERDEYRKALETLLKYLQIEVDRNFIRCILDKYPSTP